LVVVLSEKLTAAEAEIAELPPQLGRNSYRRRFGAPSSKDVATFNRWHSSGTSK
jgi:hypothetical protein